MPAITSKGTGGWPVARPVSAPSSSHSCDGCLTARECQVDAEVLRKFPPIECWCVRRVTNSRSRLTSQQCWPRHLRPGEPAHGRTDPRSQGSIRASMGLFGRFASRQPGMQTQQRRRFHLRQASRGCHGAPCGRPLPPLQLTSRGKPPRGYGLTMELQVRSTKVGCYRCRSSRCQVNDNGSSDTGSGTLLTLSLLTLDARQSPHTGPKMTVWVLK